MAQVCCECILCLLFSLVQDSLQFPQQRIVNSSDGKYLLNVHVKKNIYQQKHTAPVTSINAVSLVWGKCSKMELQEAECHQKELPLQCTFHSLDQAVD